MQRPSTQRSFPATKLWAVVVCCAAWAGAVRADEAANAGAGAKPVSFQMASLMDDPTYIGGEVASFLIPAGWKFEGQMTWDFASTFPAKSYVHVCDPNSVAAFEAFPLMLFYWDTNRNGIGYHPPVGAKYAGGIVRPPVRDVFTAIQQIVVPTFRKDLVNARIVKTEKLPKLAEFVSSHTVLPPGCRGEVFAGCVRFEYVLNGQPVEEDVITAFTYITSNFHTIDWRLTAIRSTRAPKGKLDDVKMLRLVMDRSTTSNVKWYNKLFQFAEMANRAKLIEIQKTKVRTDLFNQMTNELNEQRKQRFEKHIKDIGDQALVVDQYIRGVTPYASPKGPPIELPSTHKYAWQGSNGEILQVNDPSYNPNSDPARNQFSWTRLEPVR